MKRASIVLCFLIAILSTAQNSVVPVDREPVHHLVLDNDYLRMFDVTVAPHASTLMHRHERDYAFVVLGDAEISNERTDAKPVRAALNDGEVRYAKGGFQHIARNLADTPFHNMTIEFKNPGEPVCGIDPMPACTAPMILSTVHVVIRLISLQPEEEGPVHTHPYPHLGLALDDLTFEDRPAGKPSYTLSMKKGEFIWVIETSITHSFKNIGPKPARLLALEFK